MPGPELLAILRCPETHQPLRLAEAKNIEQLNTRIGKGELRNRAGQVISEPLSGGLVREDGQWLYPVHAGLPILLIDEGINLG